MRRLLLNLMSMRKLIIFLLILGLPALAEEDEWNDIYDTYKDTQYGKVISGQEYDNAVKTMEKYQKKDKKKKKEKEEPVVTFTTPPSRDLLLALITDISYNERIIPRGFYLVSSLYKDNKHYIRLTQGEGRVISDIEATSRMCENLENSILSEITQDNMLKLTLTDNNQILEAYLWIQ